MPLYKRPVINSDVYSRGSGVSRMKCDDGRTQDTAGLCYKACPTGFRGVPGSVATCEQIPPAGFEDGATAALYKRPVISSDVYSRGAGVSRMKCDDGRTQDTAGLCYKACPAGFRGVPGSVATCEHIPPAGFENGATAALYQRPVTNSDVYSRGAGVSRMKCDDDRTETSLGMCSKPCPTGFRGVGGPNGALCEHIPPAGFEDGATAALYQRPVIESDKYLRKLEGPSLSMTLRKRKAPVPGTSENDVKNSTLGKRALELGSAVKSGDPLAIASSAAVFSIASSPFTQAFGLAPLTDLIPSGQQMSEMANDAEWT